MVQKSDILLHGLVHRSLRHTIDSLRRHVIAPLERIGPVELVYHSWDVAEVRNPRAGEADTVLDASVIKELLPEAKGLIEPQEDYIRTLDWERLSRRNPMRHCTSGEEAAALTLRNYLLALESQQRAWRVFEENRTSSSPGLVVATRADLRFLDELEVPEALVAAARSVTAFHPLHHGADRPEVGPCPRGGGGQACPPSLWVPKFHAWGGVNDRFAIGNEEAIRLWSHRMAFAEEWLERAKGESAEWLLMKWLEKNRVKVGFMDFTFQRIRANGKVADRDRELKPKPAAQSQDQTQERFLILARVAGTMTEQLIRVLNPLGKVEVIVDRPLGDSFASAVTDRRYIHLNDGEAAGFGGLMSKSGPFPKITAWSRAFAHLARTLEDEEAVWFVEDDVAGDVDSFAALVAATRAKQADLSALDIRTRHEDAHWPWWSYADGILPCPARAFQPLCRLSGRLIRAVLDFQKRHQRFTFHEVLFASLAQEKGMSWLDWRKEGATKDLVTEFLYRPDVARIHRGVSHPVKDPDLHRAICTQTPLREGRRQRAACEGWSILADDYDFLADWCRKQGFRHVVEFGPGDSTLALLDAGCRVVSYEHDIGWLKKSLERFRSETEVEILHLPEGDLPEVPAIAPDCVLVDGPPYREGQTMSRLGPCEWALRVCGCFLLHDTRRDGEIATLAEMERRGMQVTQVPTAKGLALVVDPKIRPELAQEELLFSTYGHRLSSPWLDQDLASWRLRLGSKQPSRMLTTAVADIAEASALLNLFFPHPASEIHAVAMANGQPEAPDGSRSTSGKIHWYDGEAREVLAWMIAGEGFWEGFDFIHLAGSVDGPAFLGDACQAWSLLKPGGLMMLEADLASAAALDAFSGTFQVSWTEVVKEKERLLVRKR